MDYSIGVQVRRRCCGQPAMEEILKGSRLQWVGHMQRMGRERLPKAALNAKSHAQDDCGGEEGVAVFLYSM